MPRNNAKPVHWDFLSLLVLASCAVLQIVRWPMFPQFMDTFYHLHTAWGFNLAGGYSSWDFWQYAPVGRPHIYPPFFHIALALILKTGMPQIILAKLLEVTLPIILLASVWRLCRKRFGDDFAFWTSIAFVSSFGFFSSLANHLPSTSAFILGTLAVERMWRRDVLRAALLLGLIFYTHIGMAWFWALVMVGWGAVEKKSRRHTLLAVAMALVMAAPFLFAQAAGLAHIARMGYKLNESLALQLKPFNILLAVPGLILAIRRKEYRFFLCVLLATLVFLPYPFRLVSAEGFFAIILLNAAALRAAWQKCSSDRVGRAVLTCAVCALAVLSPTIARTPPVHGQKTYWKMEWFDSAPAGTLLAKGQQLWMPQQYVEAAQVIRQNTGSRDILVSSLDMFGVILAVVSGRPTANALLPEVKASRRFDSLAVSRMIVIPKDEDAGVVESAVREYNLEKIGENKFFLFLLNPSAQGSMLVRRATVGWPVILFCLGIWAVLLLVSISLEFSGE
jgi:hypothetical protein